MNKERKGTNDYYSLLYIMYNKLEKVDRHVIDIDFGDALDMSEIFYTIKRDKNVYLGATYLGRKDKTKAGERIPIS